MSALFAAMAAGATAVILLCGPFPGNWAVNVACTAVMLWIMAVLAGLFPAFATEAGLRRAGWLWQALSPAAMLPAMEWLHAGPPLYFSAGTALAVVLYAAMIWALFALSGRSRLAQIAVAAFWWILALTNCVKIALRGTPLVPWDIYALDTALDVLGGYAFPITWARACSGLYFALFCAVSARLPARWNALLFRPPRRRRARAAALLAALGAKALLLWATLDVGSPIYLNLAVNNWALSEAYRMHGFTTAMLNNCKQLIIVRPADYAPERVRAALEAAIPPAPPAVMAAPPVNILVIMNESFADLQTVVGFSTDGPVLEGFRRLYADTLHGTLHTSVYGGGTSVTEFEVLTASTLAFLPPDSSPYVQYMQPSRRNGYSLAGRLKSMGYRTLAVHPADARNWNRDRTYPLMGFDAFLSLDDMPDRDGPGSLLRGHYRDDALYARLLRILGEKPAGEKLFIHCVTMQNHGGYEMPLRVASDLRVRRLGGKPDRALDNYLTLANLSGDALCGFLEELSALDEPTLVLFFGDHPPITARPLVEDCTGEDWWEGDLTRRMPLFETPFLLWSNRPLPAADLGDLSPEDLGPLLMQVAGLPLNAYQRLVAEAGARWPVLTAQGARNAEGAVCSVEDALRDDPLLRDYQAAQYNLLFDTVHKLDALFE
jgi:phosphoglycerol transferase MdoB-like AlkP superfamily enzyme